jgi:hypothetical protein
MGDDHRGFRLMQQGGGGMGSRKHGKVAMRRSRRVFEYGRAAEAERIPESRRPKTKFLGSICELSYQAKAR